MTAPHCQIKTAVSAREQYTNELQVTLDTVTAGISHLKHRRVEWANVAHDKMFGYARGETRGIETAAFYPDRASFERLGQAAYPQLWAGKTYSTEMEMQRKDGTRFWCSLTGRAVNDQDPDEGSIWMIQDITERKRIESALAQSRQDLDLFFNTIEDLLFVLDETGNMIHVNQAVCRKLGYTHAELIGRHVLEVHPPERRAEAGRIVGEMLAGQTAFCPVPVMTKSGKHIPVETRVVAGEWAGKSALFGVTRDMSEIKRSEEKFAGAFHAGGVLMAISTVAEGRFLDANDTFLDTLGYTRAEVIGKTSHELNLFVNPQERETIRQQTLAQGFAQNVEVQMRDKHGALHNGLFSVRPLQIGEEPHWLTVMTDITERKRAEAELRESEAHYRNLFDYLPIPVFTKNLAGEYTSCNAENLKYWTINPVGHTDLELLPSETATALHAIDLQVIKNEEMVTVEEQFTVPSGVWQMLARKIPLRDASGNIIGILGASLDITERKRAEQALRESQARFRAFFDHAAVGVAQVATDGHFMDVNQKFSALLGYTRAELLTLAFQEITHPEDVETNVDYMRRMLKGELDSFVIDKRYLCKDGSLLWVNLSTSVIRDADNQPKYFITVIEDLTERKQLMQDLQRERDFVTQVLDTMGQGLTVTNEHQRFILINQAYAKLFGYRPEELMGKQPSEITAVEDRSVLEQARQARLRGETTTYETRLQNADGAQVPVLITGVPYWVNGKVSGTIAVVTDLTDIKRAEEALRRERNLLRTVIDTIPDQVFAKDWDSRFVINNRADALMMGVADPETLTGKSDFDFYPSEFASAFRADDQVVIMTNQPVTREEPTQDAAGRTHWVRVTKVPWREPNGQVVGIVGIATDITERKELEQRIDETNKKLVEQVDELSHLQTQLREQALRDPLTQLYNRRYLNETLPREIARALRQNQKLGVLMLDLDHFKQINDTHGHGIGDVVLQSVARLLQAQLRASDIVCRYGGEEILCLLLNTTEDIVYQRAEQLRGAIEEMPIKLSAATVHITASIGVAVLPPDGTDMIAVLNAADAALYQAKQAGRNCVRMAHAEK